MNTHGTGTSLTSIRRAPSAELTGDAEFAAAILSGLSAPAKSLPCRYFYDQRGSHLFEEITHQPEYYLTRTEIALLHTHAYEIANGDGDGQVLVEFGSGSSRKTEILLEAMPRLAAYIPIDVSADALTDAQARLRTKFPALSIRPLHGSFMNDVPLPSNLQALDRLGFFPGSTIGNFARPMAIKLLSSMRRLLTPNGRLIIGVDLVKDERVLLDAYNDDSGITAAFNLNLLQRINRTFGPAFDLEAFRHEAIFNKSESRIEMHLVSTRDQVVRLLGTTFRLKQGETIHTEDSHKYTLADFSDLARQSGWVPRRVWTDERAWFSIHELAAG